MKLPVPEKPTERLLDLLERWQALQGQGRSVSATEVCSDCPELAGDLERLAQFTQQVQTLAGESALQGTTAPVLSPTLDLPAPSRAPVMAPEERYVFEGQLGRGGMGAVYRVQDRSLGRTVALKVIRPEAMSTLMRVRFEAEARAVAQLDHPHIVKVFDVGQIRPPDEPEVVPFLTLEFVQGGSLEKKLDDKPMATGVAVRLVALLARAMQHAHERGIIHRDLKPDNVLLAPPSTMASLNTPLGCPRITDFGLAKALMTPAASNGRKSGELLTQPGAVMGTPSYMAPEQAEGLPDIGTPADVWALGVILYRLLTGSTPFEAPTLIDLLHKICTQEPPAIERLRPGLSIDLVAVVRDCLKKSPADRPTAAALAERLEGILQSADLDTADGSTRPAPPPHRSRSWGKREIGILAALILVASAGLTWKFWPNDKDEGAGRTNTPIDGGNGQTTAVKIRPLRVVHYATVGAEEEAAKVIGDKSFTTNVGDRVTLTVELNAPGYFYLIGFNYNGEEQLLWPLDEKGGTSPSAHNVTPPQLPRLHFPPGGMRWELDEPDTKSGLQAYAVVASSKPLPPYAEWKKGRSRVTWNQLPAGKHPWVADVHGVYPVLPGLGVDRGSIQAAAGVPPLMDLCRALKSGGVDAVEMVAFPVTAKEGK